MEIEDCGSEKEMKVLQIIGLYLILVGASFAQGKIGFVDTNAFEDERLGVTELVNANAKIVAEFKPVNEKLYPDIEKHKSLQKQIEIELPICKAECFSLEQKIDEYEKLSNRIKLRIEEINVLFEKRKAEIVEPIKKRIADNLKEFAKQKGYTAILDNPEKQGCICEGSVCVWYIEYPNITKEFIKFCNEAFEKEKIQNK